MYAYWVMSICARFWKNLGNQISKIDSSEAAIHIFGFQLSGTDQGTKVSASYSFLKTQNETYFIFHIEGVYPE